MAIAHGEYRDRLFTFIFGSEEHKDWTLSLYNAVNGTDYTNSDEITITTIHEVLYLGMRNDVSFLLADEMNLYEQQSTYNPNMPLRMLQYAGSLYEKYLKEHRLNKYARKQLLLPVPKLLVFHTGAKRLGGEVVLSLSSSFPEGSEPDIEVRVRMVDVHSEDDPLIVQQCSPLREYAWTTERIRDNMKLAGAEKAVDDTLEAMPDSFAIKPYLMAHKAEVRDMLLTEYNEAETMELFREEGREEGRREGRRESTLEHAARLMSTLGLTAERALETLGVPEVEYDRYLPLLVV